MSKFIEIPDSNRVFINVSLSIFGSYASKMPSILLICEADKAPIFKYIKSQFLFINFSQDTIS